MRDTVKQVVKAALLISVAWYVSLKILTSVYWLVEGVYSNSLTSFITVTLLAYSYAQIRNIAQSLRKAGRTYRYR